MPKYCFAYGSNCDVEDWAGWCARSGHEVDCVEPVGPAILPDARLAFDYYSGSRGGGALNVRDRVGGVVEGLLLRVGAAGWRALDAKEGVRGRYYERVSRTAILPDGSAVPVTCYEVTRERREDAHVPPTDAYIEAVRRGFRAHGLDTGALDAAAEGREGCVELSEVFAYGTLMSGECRHSALGDGASGPPSPARARGGLLDLGAYPAMVLGQRGWVRGEAIPLASAIASLPALDAIEGARGRCAPGGLYRRTVVRARVGDAERRAWAWVADPDDFPGAPAIGSGDWRRRA